MLVLTRKAGEAVHIGANITITVVSVEGGRVRIGIDAPLTVPIVRNELAAHSNRATECCTATAPANGAA